MLPTKLGFIWQSSFREKDSLEINKSETRIDAFLEGPLYRMHIYFRSVNKHGHHRQFLFLIGWFLNKIVSSKSALPNESKLGMKHPWKEDSLEINKSETRIACGGHVY
jgi:hypothetical protein